MFTTAGSVKVSAGLRLVALVGVLGLLAGLGCGPVRVWPEKKPPPERVPELVGKVVHAETKAGLPEVRVTAKKEGQTVAEAQTDAEGFYRMTLAVGRYAITAFKSGFIAQTVTAEVLKDSASVPTMELVEVTKLPEAKTETVQAEAPQPQVVVAPKEEVIDQQPVVQNYQVEIPPETKVIVEGVEVPEATVIAAPMDPEDVLPPPQTVTVPPTEDVEEAEGEAVVAVMDVELEEGVGQFSKPVTLTLPLPVPAPPEAEVPLKRLDPATGQWEDVGVARTDPEGKRATAETTQTGVFAVVPRYTLDSVVEEIQTVREKRVPLLPGVARVTERFTPEVVEFEIPPGVGETYLLSLLRQQLGLPFGEEREFVFPIGQNVGLTRQVFRCEFIIEVVEVVRKVHIIWQWNGMTTEITIRIRYRIIRVKGVECILITGAVGQGE